MLSVSSCLPTAVQTLRGVQMIKDMNFDSLVFVDYITGKPVKAVGLKPVSQVNTFLIHYSDGRSSYYRADDYLWLDNQIVPTLSVVNALSNLADCSNGAIGSRDRYLDFHQSLLDGYQLIGVDHITGLSFKAGAPIPYDRGIVVGAITPDPYVAGYIFPYADMTDEYVNIPSTHDTMLDSICLMAGIKPTIASENKIHFTNQFNGRPVKWDDFLSIEVNNSLRKSAPHDIPDIYTYASEADRWEFIRGAFDAGNKIKPGVEFADMELEIRCYRNRIETLADIIRSLGFAVSVDSRRDRDDIHILRVIDSGRHFNKFFNDVETVERVQRYVNSMQTLYDDKVYITGIEYAGKSTGYKIMLPDFTPPKIIYEGNFLPRVVCASN